jgi:hypothetical protein
MRVIPWSISRNACIIPKSDDPANRVPAFPQRSRSHNLTMAHRICASEPGREARVRTGAAARRAISLFKCQRAAITPPRSRGAFCVRALAGIALEKARGRREGRVLAAPMVRLQTKSRRRHHRYEPNNRPSLRDGLNGVLRALPGDRAFLPPSVVGLIEHCDLSASVGTPGPHDFSVPDLDDRLSPRPRPSHPVGQRS